MSTATKLSYLNETKSQLKDMINYGLPTENQITNETTFRNYVKGIFEAFIESLRDSTTLYTNLPKISGNGTQITLNDTANVPMRITLKASELTQDGTPSPSSPQDIHTISGNNSIQINGENLCNTFIATKPNWQAGTLVVNSDGSLTLSNNTGSNNYFQLNQKLKELCPSLQAGDIAYLYLDTTSSSKRIYISGMGGAGWFNGASLTITDTLLNNAVVIYGGYNQTDTIKITITKEQVATEYKPYQEPQTAPINLDTIEYCKIGNYEDEFILTSGKNSFNPVYMVATQYNYDLTINTNANILATENNGIITFNHSNANNGTKLLNKILLEAGTYTLSYKIRFTSTGDKQIKLTIKDFDNNTNITDEWIYNMVNDNTYTKTFTITEQKNVIFGFTPKNAPSGTCQIYNVMLSTENIDYEPYGTNQWYLKKNIGKVVLDGSESWNERTNSSGTKQFYAPTDLPVNSVLDATQKCTHFNKYRQSLFNYGAVGEFAILTNNRIFYGGVEDTLLLEDFKTSLASNNLEVYYILATPTYTQITGTLETQLNNIYEKLLSYKGTTNISQVNNDLPFVLGVSAIQDLE